MKKVFSILIISLIFISHTSAQEVKVKEPENSKFGLSFNTLSPKEKAFNGLTKGVVIHKVSKDHPAKTAGLLEGDILTHVGIIEIIDQAHCQQVFKKNIDSSIGSSRLKIIRNGVKMDVLVKFE